VAGRGLRPSSLPRGGRLLSALPPTDEPPPLLAGGKVLDASAVASWARGGLGMASWSTIASELGLTLLVPSAAIAEALLALPDAGLSIDVLLNQPTVLVLDEPSGAVRAYMDEGRERDGVFDPLATWISAICRERGWPAISSDPGRLRRAHPDVQIDLV
jgi:predicted nucleic acid-binding protein